MEEYSDGHPRAWKKSPHLYIAALLAAILVPQSSLFARTQATQTSKRGRENSTKTNFATQNEQEQKREKEKRGEIVVAPIPISSPDIGSGLEWAIA